MPRKYARGLILTLRNGMAFALPIDKASEILEIANASPCATKQQDEDGNTFYLIDTFRKAQPMVESISIENALEDEDDDGDRADEPDPMEPVDFMSRLSGISSKRKH